MGWKKKCTVLLATALGTIACSCTQEHPDTAPSAARRRSSVVVPLLLRGADTRMQLSLPSGDQSVAPGSFEKDEICYLTAGRFRIDCFDNGSTLNLGPEDSTPLLSDNPMWDITSDEDDPLANDCMRLYGVIFLVGSSVERLPDTLADYIQEPGRHENEAIALAMIMINSKRIELEGHARGGNFKLFVQLTDAGRDKLVEALDEAGETSGGNQLVAAMKQARGAARKLIPVRSQPHR